MYKKVDSNERAVRAPPALNPEQLALTQPWKDYVSMGLIVKLACTFTPGGTQVSVDISDAFLGDSVKTVTGLAPGMAKQIILASGLAPTRGGKTKGPKAEEPLPVRSLCAKDLEAPENIPRRIKQVADKLGPSTALGRIGSLKLHIEGTKSFEDWWSLAAPADKVRLVMDKKHYDEVAESKRSELLKVFDNLNSPFRGSFPVQTSNDEAKEKIQTVKPTVKATAKTVGKK